MSCTLNNRQHQATVTRTTIDYHFHSLKLVDSLPTIAEIALRKLADPSLYSLQKRASVDYFERRKYEVLFRSMHVFRRGSDATSLLTGCCPLDFPFGSSEEGTVSYLLSLCRTACGCIRNAQKGPMDAIYIAWIKESTVHIEFHHQINSGEGVCYFGQRCASCMMFRCSAAALSSI